MKKILINKLIKKNFNPNQFLKLKKFLSSQGIIVKKKTSFKFGYEKFKMYLLGESDSKPKNAEWAEKICGVRADQIKSIARKIVRMFRSL